MNLVIGLCVVPISCVCILENGVSEEVSVVCDGVSGESVCEFCNFLKKVVDE